jgi:hypothetical protein
MALGDGIRRNIASVDPAERALLRDALVAINHRYFPGARTDSVPGGVSWWFKQDEIHQATHVHHGPEFLPWHREIVNRMEEMLRQINPQLSLHYWDWTQDPRAIPNANLGGGTGGTLNLFTTDFMGYGGATSAPIGEPWRGAGYYVPGASLVRDTSDNPADPPDTVYRYVSGSPASSQEDDAIRTAPDFPTMRVLMETVHDAMHGFVAMGNQHISFRDPFVFLLHSNVDRLFALWQTQPGKSERLDPELMYGSESGSLNANIEPWSTGHSFAFGTEFFTRPWYAPENQGVPHDYKHPSIVFPPCYDTNVTATPVIEVMNVGTPPVLNFNDVPSGETAVRAAIFRIFGCGDVTVRVKGGAGPAAPFSVLLPASGSLTVHHASTQNTDARIWLSYTGGPAGTPVPDGAATFECPENGKEFTFVLKANSISRPTVAVMMALDQSGSMNWAAGTSGATRLEVLKDAGRKFMELIQQDNGVGLVRFDHNAYGVNDPIYPGLVMTRIASNNMFDVGRVAAISAVNNHGTNPFGNTSVGDGVDLARQVLSAVPPGDYAHKAMIVLTDGLENDPLWIADVAGSIDSRTFAIGLGNESQVNTAALRALANGTGGYLLLTGVLSSSIDDYFRLSKYFLQILAGVTNNTIVLDPSGFIAPGARLRIPFYINETDIDCTTLVMTDHNVIDLMLEAPDTTVITPAMVPGLGMTFGVGNQTKHYRFTLPVAVGGGQTAGVWHALLAIDPNDYKKTLSRLRDRKDQHPFQTLATHGARYSLAITTYSNLKMEAAVEQSSFEPGATLTFQAVLTEYGIPVEGRARVQVELTRPGGAATIVSLIEVEPGTHRGTTTVVLSGVYHGRFLAKGVTLRGTPFTREHRVTAAVWTSGDDPYQPPRDAAVDWCRLLNCLVEQVNASRSFKNQLRTEGIDFDRLRRCVDAVCHKARLRG